MIHINASGHRGRYNNSKVGVFVPIHGEKYFGERPIVFKSRLEQKMMRYLDRNPKVVKWSYEPISVKYMDTSSKPPRTRNYHIDFVAYVTDGRRMKQVWIEVKSRTEVSEPNREKRIEHQTWVKNQCKWKTARTIAESRGCQFRIITEDQLN